MNKSKLIQAKICDFFELKQGFAFPSKDFSKDGDLLVIKIKNIKSSGLDLSKKEFVSIEYSQTHKEFVPEDEDLLISLSGNRYEGSIETWAGKVSYYSGSPFCIINQRVGILRKRKNTNIDTRYFYYLLSTIEEQKKLILIATSSGGQANLSKEQILTHKVNIHSFSEQKAIAHILGTLDEKIILNKKTNETLEDIAKALFKSWFIDFDPVKAKAEGRSTGLPDEISDLFPTSFIDSDIGKIPKNWLVSSIDEFNKITMGQSPPGSTYNESGEGLPFYQGKTDFGFRHPTRRIFCSEPKRIAEQSSTLISVRAPVGSINLANESCCIGRGVASIKSNEGHHSFTYYLLNGIQSLFDVYNSEGTVFGAINKNDLSSIRVVKSPTNIRELFNEFASKIDHKIFLGTKEINLLKSLRHALLPKLISGELRITDAEKMIEEAGI